MKEKYVNKLSIRTKNQNRSLFEIEKREEKENE